jgi:alpha-mannosidase
MQKIFTLTLMLIFSLSALGLAQNVADTTNIHRDLYVVGTAHLDTQWRWTIQNTINEYVPATFRDNFKLMDIYPDYKFSFEGAFKYMLFKEYHPDEYKKLKGYIDRGQWNLAGSWVDAVDVNMPSFESLVRQTLYGNGFYKQEFGKTSKDIFLPDCFGFGYALPSIAAHCGLKSFSTQKLTWGCSVPVPFDIGLWQGVDGTSIVAALNPGDYTGKIRGDLSRDTTWIARINKQGASSGLYAAYRYFGTGDTGGSPDSLSVDWLTKSLKSDGPVKVHSIGSDSLPVIVKSDKAANLQSYNGELLMTRHGTGCYTSEAAMKRWNRKNELLADATERACVIANLVAGAPYPKEDLKNTWTRFLWHQFHDDLTGTSIPEAYQFSWNDEILCQNRFSQILTSAVEATAAVMDTRAKGIPIVVYNPLSIEREDVVEATIPCFDTLNGKQRNFMNFGVYSGEREVPSGVVECDHFHNKLTLNFIANAPSVGYAVYDIRPSEKLCEMNTGLNVTENSLENNHYLVKLNNNGEVTSIFDKMAKRELLSSPISLQFIHDKPGQWPAWEIQYEDIVKPPMTGAIKETKTEILETGPVRVSLLITQKTANSVIRTIVSLAAGDSGDRIEFDNDIDWYERETLLKVAFNLTTPNDSVTYDIGLGTILRGINTAKKYEVPGQQWADMTSNDGSYGVAALNDCKYGWDHPDSSTLRLSLIHTPGVFESWNWVGDQKSQDNGHHEFKYALAGHKGDWRDGNVVWQAARLNQPLMAFRTSPHDGKYGKSYTLMGILSGDKNYSRDKNPPIKVTAIKGSEDSDNIIIRAQELLGKTADNSSILVNCYHLNENYEVNGIENKMGIVDVKQKEYFAPIIITSFAPYQPRAFTISQDAKMDIDYSKGKEPIFQLLHLPYNHDGISLDSNRKDGDFDGAGNTISGDLLPDTLTWLDVPYIFGPKEAGKLNVVTCSGQTLLVPNGQFNKINLLVTAVGGPQIGAFIVDGKATSFPIPDYAEFIGQWNSRVIAGEIREDSNQIAPGYINTTPVAWYGTHRHTATGENEAYRFTYLFLITLDLPAGAKEVTLPNNGNIKILAATAVKTNRDDLTPAQPLYDRANGTLTDIHCTRKVFLDNTVATITSPNPGAQIHYTLNGKDPTKSSPLYDGPIALAKTTTVKSRAILPSADDHFVTSVTFNQLIPHEAVTVKELIPGLDARYFEAHWSKVPNFDSLTAIKEFIADSISIPTFAKKEDFGLTFTGFIKVPSDGLYDFYISSDDGTRLYVSDSLVIDNDGLHGEGEMLGEIALKAGYHPIYLPMFQATGDEALELSIEGPGIPKQLVQESMLFHAAKMKRY